MAGAWTNNWEGIKRIVATNMTSAGTVVLTSGGRMTEAFADGQTKPSMPMDALLQGSTASLGYVVLIIGGEQSSVTPSASDYNIYGPITSGITYVSSSNGAITYDPDTGIAERTSSVTIQNTEAGAKTVYEWGLFGAVNTTYKSGSKTYTRKNDFLLYRGTLDTPVTLQQFETITITFTRRMQINV